MFRYFGHIGKFGGNGNKLNNVTYTTLLDTFSQAAELSGSNWVMPSLVGSDIPIKRKCVKCNGTSDYANTSVKLPGATAFNFTWKGQIDSIDGVERILMFTGGTSAALIGILVSQYNNTVRVRIANGTYAQLKQFPVSYTLGAYNTINVQWNGLSTGYVNCTVNGVSATPILANLQWSGNTPYPVGLWKNTQASISFFNSKTSYMALEGYFEYTCDNASGTTLFDSSGHGNNATVYTSDAAAFWGQTLAGAEPFALTRGCTINSGVVIPRNQADQTKDVQGNTLQYPAGSGIINGLGNLYTFPTDTDLNVEIPAGDYTWAQIDALTDSATLVKTKPTTNQLSRLVVKKKLVETNITEFNNLTTYNNISTYNG